MQRRTYYQGPLVYLQPPQSDHGVLVSNVGVLWQWQSHVTERNPWLNFWGLRGPSHGVVKTRIIAEKGGTRTKHRELTKVAMSTKLHYLSLDSANCL